MSEVLSKITCDHISEGNSCGLVVTLVEQNAKLRELVKDLYDHAEFSIHYFGDIYGICDRMRELEIEV